MSFQFFYPFRPARIFLSYASEQQPLAQALSLRLQTEGHQVFFDRTALPPEQEFDQRIRREIQRAALFIFLVSSGALAPHRYTQTELVVAQERWPHPSGAVLPVLVAPVPMAQVPPYLRAVTMLAPRGDISADVTHAVQQLACIRRQKPLAVALSPVALFLVLSVVGLLWFWTGGRFTCRQSP